MSLLKPESRWAYSSFVGNTNNKNTNENEDIEEYYHQKFMMRVNREKNVIYETKVSQPTRVKKKQNSQHYQRSHSSRDESKNGLRIDAYEKLPIDRPLTAPIMRRNSLRPKNFLVRVFPNGDYSRFAYCASCSMNLILTEATRKLQLIKPARRLFGPTGQEILRSEDIKRDLDYSVSWGDNYIRPSTAIKHHLICRKSALWTMDGIEIRYRKRLRSQSPISDYNSTSGGRSSSSSTISRRPEPFKGPITPKRKLKPISTQTDPMQLSPVIQSPVKLQSVYTQSDLPVLTAPAAMLKSVDTQTSLSPALKLNSVDTQTDKVSPISMKVTDTQTDIVLTPITKSTVSQTDEISKIDMDPVDTQTGKISKIDMDPVDTQTGEISKIGMDPVDTQTGKISKIDMEPVDTQTDEISKIDMEPVDTQTDEIPKLELKTTDTQTDGIPPIEMKTADTQTSEIKNEDKESDKKPPSEIKTEDKEPDKQPPSEIETEDKEPDKKPRSELKTEDKGTNTLDIIMPHPIKKKRDRTQTNKVTGLLPLTNVVRETTWRQQHDENQTGQVFLSPNVGQSTPIYFRPTRTTNFRVKVYRNGDRSRYAYCKSCSMDILFAAATDKLQMPVRARRLFDVNGIEIYHSNEIRRDQEYFVSSGANYAIPSN
ncbi:unnamed protein product [Rotaria magnacalcarata]|uniref:Doublecortin domain-containing protein n=1 Tax=Rotaria magnacalcarata TaxID=392030 RepID=A0A819UTN9_9BILA|nr:unnamed protein product [Rotaria magnacalcarata]CAF4097971.1 unnamed protein product [Rotaria magnacalcarata]